MAKEPNARFLPIGKGKVFHVFRTEAWDRKHSTCTQARKALVAGKIDYRKKGISPEAVLELIGCPQCGTHEVAKRLLPAEAKQAARKDQRDVVLERTKPNKPNKLSERQQRDAEDKAVIKARREADKAILRGTKVSMTKTGPRSTGDSQGKAQALADYGKEYGWDSKLVEEGQHVIVNATKGDQLILCWFIDGKYDESRIAELHVGDWVGKLRGAHACRRQMAGVNPVHPQPGVGGSRGRKSSKAEVAVPESESPEDALKRVPFLIDDDPAEIIDALMGKVIRWRNGQTGSLSEARIPSTIGKGKRPTIQIGRHPKRNEPYVNFFEVSGVDPTTGREVYGPERYVALAKIIRVVA